jgi:hypothetical protein
MIIKYRLAFVLIALITITKVASSQWSRQSITDCIQEPSWIYESENTDGTKILYDRGKFKLDSGRLTNRRVYYFDKTTPLIVWYYDPTEKIANPTLASRMYYFGSFVEKYGLNKVKEAYKIPDSFPESRVLPRKGGFLAAPFYLCDGLYSIYPVFPSVALTMKDYYHSKGTAVVANQKCYVFEDRSGSSVSIDYVEPTSRLVLRNEYTSPAHPGVPSETSITSAKTFKFLREIPAGTFKLPAGTTVIVPEIMKDMPLPSNVKRKILTGPNKEFGFSFEEMDRMIRK